MFTWLKWDCRQQKLDSIVYLVNAKGISLCTPRCLDTNFPKKFQGFTLKQRRKEGEERIWLVGERKEELGEDKKKERKSNY